MRIQNAIEKALLRHVQVSLNRKTLAEERKKLQKTVKLLKKIEQSQSPLKPTAFWCAAETASWNGAEIFPQQFSGQCKYNFELWSTFYWRRALCPVCSLPAVHTLPPHSNQSGEQRSVPGITDTPHLHKPPGNMQHVFENQNDQRRCRGQDKSNHSKEARLWWGIQQPKHMHNVSGKVRVRKCTKPGLTIRVFLHQKNECQSSHVS